MRFVDELYEYYKDRLTGDDEDIEIVTLSILEELSRNDLLKLIKEMDDEELMTMISLYFIEHLKAKMSEEGIGRTKMPSIQTLH
ncbi:DUF6154 family protein [Bacillus alveayuensis]|jgi:hypothetical protein|uniref:DUF6154 family protein n=1 Tax=Aeribacillus alveayuensis TaxID=279215 RepID=UPI0005CCFF1C|nr:DUF6154 family protein [Bacillus alveayuensis]